MLLFFTHDVNKDKNTGKLELGYGYVIMCWKGWKITFHVVCSAWVRGQERERERELIRSCTHN